MKITWHANISQGIREINVVGRVGFKTDLYSMKADLFQSFQKNLRTKF